MIPMYPPLEPRDGSTLHVLAIARISTKNQDERSLDDQEAYYRSWLAQRYDGPVEWTVIKTQGSGELLDRDESHEAEGHVAREQVDLVITEDLARIFRRMHAYLFCEHCVDHDTRLVAINDSVDTADDGWNTTAVFASWKGEMSNKDTSKRIKRSMDNQFGNGRVLRCEIYGYERLPGAKTDADLRKLPAAEPIYDQWFTQLEDGASYSEVADWLNRQKIPTGPICRYREMDRPDG